jgi:hypothetical protein
MQERTIDRKGENEIKPEELKKRITGYQNGNTEIKEEERQTENRKVKELTGIHRRIADGKGSTGRRGRTDAQEERTAASGMCCGAAALYGGRVGGYLGHTGAAYGQ